MITSLSNPKVKLAAALEQRKTRRETGLFVAEGVNVLASAKQQKWFPKTVFYEQSDHLVVWAKKGGAECLQVSEAVLSKISTKDNPQKIVGVFEQKWVTKVTDGTWVVLEDVRDPGNLGTIIRTADAAGSSGIVLAGNCCDPYAREAVRASMGSIFAVPLVKVATVADVVKTWRGAVVGTHLSGKEDFRQSYPANMLLVMGSEGPGMSDAAANLCTKLVRIPMKGSAESLNLATATALMLYEIRRSVL
jgi:TrmH family RNA methyltransferase